MLSHMFDKPTPDNLKVKSSETVSSLSLIYTRKHRNYSAEAKKFLFAPFARHNFCYLPVNIGIFAKDINVVFG